MNIFHTIRGEIDDFLYNDIEIVPGLSFNQYETIKRAHLYLNSAYEDNTPYNGREKLFYNIVKYRKDAAARFLNIDTKDIRLWELNPKSVYATMFLEKELKLWLKQNDFDQLLNQVADEAPTYGSIVLKKTKKGAHLVDLRRLFLDPTVEQIQDSRFVTIKHYFTPSELRKKAKENGWDGEAVENIISKKENSPAPESYEDEGQLNQIVSTPLIEVYERYGEVEEHQIKGNKDDMVRSLFIVAEPYLQSYNEEGESIENEGEILFKSKWNKNYPFEDFHYSKTRGRWLGVGVIEDLFPAQERMNELANQRRVSMEIDAIHLFQTADNTVVSNILTDLQSGDLIKTKTQGSFQRVDTTPRNLASFQIEDQKYMELADKISFANDLITGGQIAASTPATNAVIQNNNSTSIFLFKRQNLANFYREFFTDHVLPQALNDLTPKHILRFVGDRGEIMKLDEVWVKASVENYKLETTLESFVPTKEEVEAFEQELRSKLRENGNVRFVDIKEKLYEDIEFEFDILVDNEQENVGVIAQNTFSLLTAIGQNPNLLEDPVMKTLIFDYASRIGINPAKLELADAQKTPTVPSLQKTLMGQNQAQPLQESLLVNG